MPELNLQQLSLVNFKNYENQKFDFSPKLNCIVGLNGMGKTNLLDAIYYLCICKSNFGQPDLSILRHDAGFFRLEGHFVKNSQKEKVVAKIANRKKKQLERNGTAYTLLSDHIGFLPVVMIVPDDTYCTHPSLQQGDAGDDGTSTADIVQLLSKVKESGKADKDAANFIKKHDVALYVALQVCQCTMPRQCGVACAVQMPPPLSTRTHRR